MWKILKNRFYGPRRHPSRDKALVMSPIQWHSKILKLEGFWLNHYKTLGGYNVLADPIKCRL